MPNACRRLACSVFAPILFVACFPSASALAVVGASAEAPKLTPHLIMVLQRSGRVAGFCSGIVVAPKAVLTAAHCAPAGADLRIHFKAADGTPVLLPVAAAVRHPGYRADAVRTRHRSVDLALLRLGESLPDRFRPALLGTRSGTSVGTAFAVAGYGVARENDGATSGVLRAATLVARAPLSSVLLWAEDPDRRGAGACTGDSGGPVLDPGTQVVEALTLWSAGSGKAQCGDLTQAIWLGPQRAWIDGILERWRGAP